MKREFLKPFALKKGETLRIPAEFSAAGYLSLMVIKGGPVYGFRGGVSEETAKSRTEIGKNVDFDIAANSSHPCTIVLERDIGEITLFSNEADSIGFLQFVEC